MHGRLRINSRVKDNLQGCVIMAKKKTSTAESETANNLGRLPVEMSCIYVCINGTVCTQTWDYSYTGLSLE